MIGFSFSKAVLAADANNFSSKFLKVDAGVGLIIANKNGQWLITGIVQGCPAQRNKLITVGDEIVKIKANGESQWIAVKGLTLKQVEDLIQGEVGKPLHLELFRDERRWVVILLREENC